MLRDEAAGREHVCKAGLRSEEHRSLRAGAERQKQQHASRPVSAALATTSVARVAHCLLSGRFDSSHQEARSSVQQDAA